MAGVSVPLWTKRSFNFNNLTAALSETQVPVKAVPSERYREGLLIVRAHTRDIVASSSKIEIVVYTTSPSPEDPSVDFVFTTASGTASIGQGSTSVVASAALANFGAFLRVVVIGTRATATNCSCDLSAEIVFKE